MYPPGERPAPPGIRQYETIFPFSITGEMKPVWVELASDGVTTKGSKKPMGVYRSEEAGVADGTGEMAERFGLTGEVTLDGGIAERARNCGAAEAERDGGA